MSLLLYIVGALAFALGILTIGFGISIELSFGNSLVVAGTTAAVGGLIVIGLGLVVAQLQRIAEALGARTPIRPSRMPEMFEAAGAPQAGARVPFPPKPKSGIPSPMPPAAAEAPVTVPATTEKPAEAPFAAAPFAAAPSPAAPFAAAPFAAAPVLPNPAEPHEEVTLSPFQPAVAPAETGEAARSAPPFAFGGAGDREAETETDHGWRLPPIPKRPQSEAAPPPVPEKRPIPPSTPQATHFDSMWPVAESKPAKPAATAFGKAEPQDEPETEPKAEPKAEPEAAREGEPVAGSKPEPAPAAGPAPAEPTELEAPGGAGEARTVAILKSGVVDGMGYTLYVDGSIEAELPQGTLRFASINDLRNYLENNGQS